MSAPSPSWPPARVEQLRRHFEAGLTCSQIAGEIGVSRNAVIGKLSRLGLTRPRGDNGIPRKPRPPRADAAQRQVRVLRTLHARMRAVAAEEPEPVGDRPRCSLFDLGAQTCRWPIGRPGADGFGFCGGASMEGFPYCAGHARLAYRSAARR